MSNKEAEREAYKGGYAGFLCGEDESACPFETGYQGALGEFWCDGYDDARDDHSER